MVGELATPCHTASWNYRETENKTFEILAGEIPIPEALARL
jgi:hypothetical protein